MTGYRALIPPEPNLPLIRDRLPRLDSSEYTSEDLDARTYSACEDGATPRPTWRGCSASSIE